MTLERHALQDSAFSFRYCLKPGQMTIGRCCHLCQSITQALSKMISQDAVQFCLIFKIVSFRGLMQRHRRSLIIQMKMLFCLLHFFFSHQSKHISWKRKTWVAGVCGHQNARGFKERGLCECNHFICLITFIQRVWLVCKLAICNLNETSEKKATMQHSFQCYIIDVLFLI